MPKYSRVEQNGILALNEHVNVIGCLKQNTVQQVHFSCLVHAWQSFQQMPQSQLSHCMVLSAHILYFLLGPVICSCMQMSVKSH